MKVGMIFEGTYPYVSGGVSSWGNLLMKNMKDVEFVVIHVGAVPKEQEKKYEIPRNVEELFEFYLYSTYKWKRRKIKESEAEELFQIMEYPFDERIMARGFENVLRKIKEVDFTHVVKTKAFWNFLEKMYSDYLSRDNFTEFFWMVRGMVIPILNALSVDLPECDIYHSVSTGYAGLAGVSGKLRNGKPLIITEHGIYHRERQFEILHAGWIDERFKTAWIKLFTTMSAVEYALCDRLTTLFRKNAEFQMEYCRDKEKIRVIPNGIDYEKFANLKKEKKSKDPYIVGLVGRVVEIKDIKTAIKSAKLVSEKVKRFELWIMGPTDEEPEYYEECIKMAKALNIENIVKFFGRVNVLEMYPKLDVLLLSSVSEGQPLVILEAMATGIPVVATNVGACSELVYGSQEDDLGPAGIVVSPKDYRRMAKALLKIYEDDEFRKRAGEVGRKRVEKYYTIEKMIENYRRLYEEVL